MSKIKWGTVAVVIGVASLGAMFIAGPIMWATENPEPSRDDAPYIIEYKHPNDRVDKYYVSDYTLTGNGVSFTGYWWVRGISIGYPRHERSKHLADNYSITRR